MDKITNSIAIMHTAIEFRLNVISRALCLTNTPVKFEGNAKNFRKLMLDGKHGFRYFKYSTPIRFFYQLCTEKVAFNRQKMKFLNYSIDNRIDGKRLVVCRIMEFKALVNNDKVDQENLNFFFDSLELLSEVWNSLYKLNDLSLFNKKKWYVTDDYRYYRIGHENFTPMQKEDLSEIFFVTSESNKHFNILSQAILQVAKWFSKVDEKFYSYYVLDKIKKQQ